MRWDQHRGAPVIGIFGGTFDPIHYGHLRTALDVIEALNLEEVRLIPLRQPPHRDDPTTSPQQRLELVQAAAEDNPRFRIDDRELKRSGHSYTVDTLHSLRSEIGDGPLCLLVGSDAFRGFPDWHKPDEILELAHLVVMLRPGEDHPPLYPERVTTRIEELGSSKSGKILFQPVTQLDISATDIRKRLQQGFSIRYLLPEKVRAIIKKNGLYR